MIISVSYTHLDVYKRQEQKLHPEDLREADVDLSSVLKFNGHIETIQPVSYTHLYVYKRQHLIIF